ncbi:hypothetical protein [Fodinibius salsisoli]|uniref:Lipoprotein n=1 Tax=Fodinibius salsisoli TaxID=2820877 RepID=A0ABT3PHU6_9BACT|nr:hypothetical protein [Fodinibius salsisoli]MCW9705500.1 hypothetical protein [Fodinibius salsisoli]
MKITIIMALSFFLLQGCSSSENMTDEESMKVVYATYKKWSEPSPVGSDVPERGTDLTLSVQHWPEEYTPQYIIYEKRQSHGAEIANKAGVTVFIEARIMKTSSVIQGTAEAVDLSDRLVYTNAEGDTSFVEIEEWNREE